MKNAEFSKIVDRFAHIKAAVVGDIFLDKIFYVDRGLDEISAETGLAAYQVKEHNYQAGAAGVVTNNLASLGVKEIYGVALTGDDGNGYDLLNALKKINVNTDYMVRDSKIHTPTYVKTFFDYEDHLEETHRIDIKNLEPTSRETEDKIIEHLFALRDKVDVFICLEQVVKGENGIFTKRVIDALAEIAGTGSMVLVDSRYHIKDFHHVIVKCNHLELLRASDYEGSLADEDEVPEKDIEQAMQAYCGRSDLPVFISCGARGMKVYESGVIETVPPFRVKGPVDICGAGDSALTGIACALCAGASNAEAALIGNLVASVIVQQLGVTGICTREQLTERFQEYEKEKEEKK